MSDLDADQTLDRRWLEQVTGGSITRLDTMPGGGSRAMYRLDVAGTTGPSALVVRRETGRGPYSGTELGSLAREASVYRALSGCGIPVPEVVALSDDAQTLVATRMPGSNDFHGIGDPDEKAAVRRDFIETLARLHALDAAFLPLDSPATTPESDPARSWLSVWRRCFERRVRRPVPLLRFAIHWLDEHPPERPARTVLCHGDVGPGNFLHAGGAVTGLLDWELAHLGDPHDDLGMLALRAYQLNAFGDLGEDLRHYEQVSGTPVDPARVRYYRAIALVLGLTTSVMQLDNPGGARIQIPLYLHLVPTLRLLLAEALADLLALDVSAPAAPDERVDVSSLEAVHALRDELAALPTSADSVLGAGINELVAHIDADARFGGSIDRDDVEELGALLGRRVTSYEEGVALLDTAVADHAVDPAGLLDCELRSARRRTVLWPAWAAAMATPLIAIDL